MEDADTLVARPRQVRPEDAIPERVARYRIVRELGRGGLGVVYEAEDPELGRTIALKLVRPDGDGSQHEDALQRLRREAQALARLDHPNVVHVFDIGEHEHQVFIAMELVDGLTLRQWLGARPRSQADVLAVLVQAGRGLSAAHEAGMVHRDFKPGNVMVDGRGRAVVLDFGLARMMVGERSDDAPMSARSGDASGGLETSLTGTGVVLGTPGYMSPEQMRGEAFDARSDQFSFCVTAFEALFGQRPFRARSMHELREMIEAGSIAEVSARGEGLRIERALARGLAPRPEQRHPSIAALLAALQVPRRRRVALLIAGVAVLGGAAAVALFVGAPASGCETNTARVLAIWGADQRAETEAAFAATGLPYADDALGRTAARLDAFATAWVAAHARTCAEAREVGADEAAFDAHVGCLRAAGDGLAATVEILAHADGAVVERSIQLVAALPDPAACSSTEEAHAVPPEIAEQVAELAQRIEETRALADAGRYDAALELAETTDAEARALGFAPLEHRALLSLADTKVMLGRFAEAEPEFEDAFFAFSEAGDDPRALQAASRSAWALSQLGRFDEAEQWIRQAEAVMQRGRVSDRDRAQALHSIAGVLFGRDRIDEAVAGYQRSLEVRERLVPVDHLGSAATRSTLAMALATRGDHEEALEHAERADALLATAVGPSHPQRGGSLANIGMVRGGMGQYAEAEEYFQRALEVFEATNTGSANAIKMRANIGLSLSKRGKHRSAVAMLQRALDDMKASLGPEHLDVAAMHANIAATQRMARDYHAAYESDRAALDIRTRILGAQSDPAIMAMAAAAYDMLELDRSAEAIPWLETVLEARRKNAKLAIDLPDLEFTLARALRGRGDDERRAVELARSALAAYPEGAPQREAIEAWLSR